MVRLSSNATVQLAPHMAGLAHALQGRTQRAAPGELRETEALGASALCDSASPRSPQSKVVGFVFMPFHVLIHQRAYF